MKHLIFLLLPFGLSAQQLRLPSATYDTTEVVIILNSKVRINGYRVRVFDDKSLIYREPYLPYVEEFYLDDKKQPLLFTEKKCQTW